MLTDQKLGSGTFSTVFIAMKADRQYACKAVKKSTMPQIHLENEIKALKLVANHSNTIELYHEQDGKGEGQDGKDGQHYLIMEILRGQDMFGLIKEWQSNPTSRTRVRREWDAAYACAQISSALSYCHKQGVVHRDIKPENLMLRNKSSLEGLTLIDFGFAAIIPEGKRITPEEIVGSPGYIAPEIRLGAPYGSPVDIWALGVLIYVLNFGFMPFPSEPIKETRLKKGTDVMKKFLVDQTEPAWKMASADAKEVLLGMLEVDPSKRMSANEVFETKWVQAEAKRRKENKSTIDLETFLQNGADAAPVSVDAVSTALENVV